MPTDDKTDPTPTTPEGKDWAPPASQADLDRIIADRLNRERSKFADYDDLKAAANRLADLENASKTEAQKQTEQLDAARAEASQASAALLRYEVAADKDIPPKLVRFLAGSTREEIEDAADELLAALPTQPARSPGRPVEALRSGATPVGDESPADVDAWIRRAVGARSNGR